MLHSDGEVANGHWIDGLLDTKRHRISKRVFADPAISRVELERVFTRSWCFVGFSSEIPKAGDYVTRTIGVDPVIVSRSRSGQVNVVLNSCSHRGTQLCMADRGSAARFKCPYHGWIFDPEGRLDAMPAERQRLSPGESKSMYDLPTASVGIYRGLIFANWSSDGPDLNEYLGAARWYMDMIFGATDDDLVPTGTPMRWSIPCDWKYGAENFTGDAYHAPLAHAFGVEAGMLPPTGLYEGLQVTDPTYGHAILHFNLPRMLNMPELGGDQLMAASYPWLPHEVLPEVQKNLSVDQWAVLQNGDLPGIGHVFPNFSWLLQPTPGGPLALIRTWNPAGPGRLELWSWGIAHPKASNDLRRSGERSNAQAFGATGVFEQDDAIIWSRMQRTRNGPVGSRQWAEYGFIREADKSNYFPDGRDFPGPGSVCQGMVPDNAMWHFYERWARLMNTP